MVVMTGLILLRLFLRLRVLLTARPHLRAFRALPVLRRIQTDVPTVALRVVIMENLIFRG